LNASNLYGHFTIPKIDYSLLHLMNYSGHNLEWTGAWIVEDKWGKRAANRLQVSSHNNNGSSCSFGEISPKQTPFGSNMTTCC